MEHQMCRIAHESTAQWGDFSGLGRFTRVCGKLQVGEVAVWIVADLSRVFGVGWLLARLGPDGDDSSLLHMSLILQQLARASSHGD